MILAKNFSEHDVKGKTSKLGQLNWVEQRKRDWGKEKKSVKCPQDRQRKEIIKWDEARSKDRKPNFQIQFGQKTHWGRKSKLGQNFKYWK